MYTIKNIFSKFIFSLHAYINISYMHEYKAITNLVAYIKPTLYLHKAYMILGLCRLGHNRLLAICNFFT